MRAGLLPLLIAVLSVGALTSSLPAAGAQTGTCPLDVTGEVGTWSRRPAPATPSGLDQVTAHAVDPQDPVRHVITDGISILVTTDDGCSWEPTFTLPDLPQPDLPASAETDRVFDLVVHPTRPQHVWAVVAVGQDVAEQLDSFGLIFAPGSNEKRDLTATLVLRSTDAGSTWTAMSAPALLPGAPIRPAVAPSDPEIGYLSINGAIFATDDAGETWTPRAPVLTDETSPVTNDLVPLTFDLAVEPGDPRRLIARTRSYALRSEDGGLTWRRLLPRVSNFPTGPYVDRFDQDGDRALLALQPLSDAPVSAFYRYREPDQKLEELAVPEEPGFLASPLAAVWHPERDEVLMATWQNNVSRFDQVTLYLIDPSTGAFVDIDELRLSPLRGVDVDVTGGYHVHNLDELVSLRVAGDPPPQDHDQEPPACEEADDVPELSPASVEGPRPAALSAPAEVTVEPGERAQAPVDLDLPATPSPLDVYFLVDTSNGFRDDIGDVARSLAGITAALAGAGVDAHFGLGGLGTEESYRYLRFVDVVPAGEPLRRGLATLCVDGSHESHLVALHQTATGSGLPDGGSLRPEVPRGRTRRGGREACAPSCWSPTTSSMTPLRSPTRTPTLRRARRCSPRSPTAASASRASRSSATSSPRCPRRAKRAPPARWPRSQLRTPPAPPRPLRCARTWRRSPLRPACSPHRAGWTAATTAPWRSRQAIRWCAPRSPPARRAPSPGSRPWASCCAASC